jgi:hypothetical protein
MQVGLRALPRGLAFGQVGLGLAVLGLLAMTVHDGPASLLELSLLAGLPGARDREDHEGDQDDDDDHDGDDQSDTHVFPPWLGG